MGPLRRVKRAQKYDTMAIASINFKPVKANSKVHNERLSELDYVNKDLSILNDSWKDSEISDRHQSIAMLTKEKTGRSLQDKATPIREAVVNIDPTHSMDDLKRLAAELKNQFGIDCFQIHIHKDEGHWDAQNEWKGNYHAHMLFDWQDKNTGKSFKLQRDSMSKIQTLVAEVLKMERGEFKENSNRERLEPIEYKRAQEQKRFEELQQQNAVLEQKKNEVASRIAILEGERGSFDDRRGQKEALRELILDFEGVHLELSEEELTDAISILENEIERIERDIERAAEEE